MRHRPAAALLHRQPRLGAVEGLDLALFIDRQHQGLVGRIEVEADDILELGDEVRIARELEGLRQYASGTLAHHLTFGYSAQE